MNHITLTIRAADSTPIDATGVLPEHLENLTAAEVENHPLVYGNRTLTLRDIFEVSVITGLSDCWIMLRGDCSAVHHIGARMTRGTIYGEAVGRHCGAQMSGGEITADSAGDWLGAEMTGGDILVLGDAGNQIGAAYRGSRRGMAGGEITVLGNVGDELGLRMRRGLIVVTGDCGAFAGASMIAGTIEVGGHLGDNAGAGMIRGTILAKTSIGRFAPGFVHACDYDSTYLRMLTNPVDPSLPPLVSHVRCYRGDLLTGGRGELLVSVEA